MHRENYDSMDYHEVEMKFQRFWMSASNCNFLVCQSSNNGNLSSAIGSGKQYFWTLKPVKSARACGQCP